MVNRKLIRPTLAEVRERSDRDSQHRRNTNDPRGSIEWYDRGCIKLHRTEGPNLLVLKHNIKYMYKTEDAEGGNGDGEDRIEDRIEEAPEE